MTRNKLTTILIIAGVAIHFCAVSRITGAFILVAVAYSLLAIYFFPLAFILDCIKFKEKKAILHSLTSGLVFSYILSLSLVLLILPASPLIRYVLLALKVVNAVLIYVHLFRTNDKNRAFWHALFGLIQ